MRKSTGLHMPSKTEMRCPCTLMCKERRETVVNLVLERGFCASSDLRFLLLKKDFGNSAIRRSLKFLADRKCNLVDVLASVDGKRLLQFPKRGRIYFSKNTRKAKLKMQILDLLTHLQRLILENLKSYHKSVYYFSLYELKRILPYAGSYIDYAINRLLDLELLEMVKVGRSKFYVKPEYVGRLRKEMAEALIEDKTEFAVVKRIHELIMNLYPLHLITRLKGTIRPRTREVLTLTGGMTFDLFYQFNEPIRNKKFLAADVYTRIPVTGYVVNSFIKKIEWAKTKKGESARYSLKDKTFGMIVFRKATIKAINIANRNNLRFIRLQDDVKINYDNIRKTQNPSLNEVLEIC